MDGRNPLVVKRSFAEIRKPKAHRSSLVCRHKINEPTAPSLNSPNTMPTLIIHVDRITPNAGYKQKGTQTEPYVQLKLRKPHSEYITKKRRSI